MRSRVHEDDAVKDLHRRGRIRVAKDLRWTGWGQATTIGSGTLEVDNCNPDCAEGTFTGYPATVTITGLTPYGKDKQAYASMTVSAPDSPYKPQTFTAGLVPQHSA